MTPNTEHSEATIIIGIGGAGRNILTKYLESNKHKALLFIDTEQFNIGNNLKAFTIVIELNQNNEDKTQSLIASQTPKYKNKILNLIKDYRNVILIAGFGGNTGGTTLPIIAEWCIDSNKNCFALVNLPLIEEGESTINRARTAIAAIDKILPRENMEIYDIEDLREITIGYVPEQLFSFANHYFYEKIDFILKYGSRHKFLNLDGPETFF